MKVTTIINGTTSLVLTPENDLEKEILKKLKDGTVSMIADNNAILNHNVSGSLLLRNEKFEGKEGGK